MVVEGRKGEVMGLVNSQQPTAIANSQQMPNASEPAASPMLPH